MHRIAYLEQRDRSADEQGFEAEIDAMLDRAFGKADTAKFWLLEPSELEEPCANDVPQAPASSARCSCARPRPYFVPGVCGRCHCETVVVMRSEAA